MPKPQRMFPKYGGEPLPWAPNVIPGMHNLTRAAQDYVKVLDKELATGEDGKMKWSGSQRQYIRKLRAKWFMRAMGEDAHYARHGTNIRPMESEPAGRAEWMTQELRRRAKDRGDYMSNAAHKRKWVLGRSARVHEIVKRWKKQSGAKNPEELKKEED